MAFSTFVFDTLDVSTRLGRYILQELIGRSSRATAIVATALTVLVPLACLLAAGEGAYRLFWVLFGTSNQLLAALSLLGHLGLAAADGRRSAFTWVPMRSSWPSRCGRWWRRWLPSCARALASGLAAGHADPQRVRVRAADRPGGGPRTGGGARRVGRGNSFRNVSIS